jgi:hypothetical protein
MQKGRSEWLLIAPGCTEKVAKQEVGFFPFPSSGRFLRGIAAEGGLDAIR